ncbi:MAG: glycosyltransferase [bacterium]|nr:glycosyltransferase [bacterium]
MSKQPFIVDILSKKQKFGFLVLASLWMGTVIVFWVWWSDSAHITSIPKFIFNSILLLWTTLLTIYFFYFVIRMKRPNPNLKVPIHWRLAMVVTKAPSEPFEIVKKTLLAMKNQNYPHDNWLADESPTPEVLRWCSENDVFVSTRKGNQAYQKQEWPRREKCKEGNLAYFYDFYGYEWYDFVSQLDADHIPEPNYLEEILKPFVDPLVGYVSAPSICDSNAATSWSARSRLYAEATLHGPLQAGYSNGWAPLCIGSHYAVRTKALKEIGGLGPELAEDHSTTFMMNVHGWKGVHALDAIAHGDGPATFADAMTQEFQWSRSLIILLLTITPKHLKRMSPRLQFQFIFSQIWYPLFGFIMVIAYLLPIIVILTGEPWTNVSYVNFVAISLMPTSSALLTVWWIKRIGLLRPYYTPILSWEMVLFQLSRWPWIIWAMVMGILTVVQKKQIEFRVTPKGVKAIEPVSLDLLTPYFVISATSALIVIIGSKSPSVSGYYYFAILNSFIYLGLILTTILMHVKEQKVKS